MAGIDRMGNQPWRVRIADQRHALQTSIGKLFPASQKRMVQATAAGARARQHNSSSGKQRFTPCDAALRRQPLF